MFSAASTRNPHTKARTSRVWPAPRLQEYQMLRKKSSKARAEPRELDRGRQGASWPA